jgi:hypothetical protein
MSNETEARVEMRWVYLPTDFFDEIILLERNEYSIEIEKGHIIARVNESYDSSRPALYDFLTNELNVYFLGLNLVQRKPFGIHRSGIFRVRPDGRSDTTLVVQDVHHKHTVDHIDLSCTDDEGQVHDSRQVRIDATKKLAELAARHHDDQTARKILNSFYDAFKDPGNELVYLYEVWEAINDRFGKGKAEDALGISASERERLKKLACKNLKQGRHRGQHLNLRDATPEELNEARAIAQGMITKYLIYLEAPQPRP